MRKKLSEAEYLKIKNYVIANSFQPNTDRCSVFFIGNTDCQMCFNDEDLSVCICDNPLELDPLAICFLAFQNPIDSDGLKRIKFYKDYIEPVSKCCDLNSKIED